MDNKRWLVLALSLLVALPIVAAAPPGESPVDVGWKQTPNVITVDQPAPDYMNYKMVYPADMPALAQEDLDKVRDMKIAVGYSSQYLTIPWSQQVVDGYKAWMQEAGVEVLVTDAANDPNKQITDIEGLIAKGVKGIFIKPQDDKAIQPAMQRAKEAGVIVIVLEDPPADATLMDAFVTQDFFHGGYIGGSMLCKALADRSPKPEVAHFKYPFSAIGVDYRIAGYKAAVKDCGLEDVAEAEGITTAEGFKVFADVLTAHPAVRGAWGYYDGVTFGAVQAFEQQNTMDAVVAAHDLGSEQTALEIAKEGSLLVGTAATQTRLAGEAGAKLMLLKILGKDVPNVIVPTVPVDKANVAEWWQTISGTPLPQK